MNMKSRTLRGFIGALMGVVMVLCLLPIMSKNSKAAAPGLYRITVDYNVADGGINVVKTYDLPGGSYFSLPSKPSLGGLEFGGWECNGIPYPAGKQFRVMGNMSFKAIWKIHIDIESSWRLNGVEFDHYTDTNTRKIKYNKVTVLEFLKNEGYYSPGNGWELGPIYYTGWEGFSRVYDKHYYISTKFRGNGKIFITLIARTN